MPDAPRHSRRQPDLVQGYAYRHLKPNRLAASLRAEWRSRVQADPDKQKTPGPASPEVFTDRRSETESPGGRYEQGA